MKVIRPQTLAIVHGEIKLALNKKFPPNWLAFTVLEGAIQCWGGRSSTVFPSSEPCELQ